MISAETKGHMKEIRICNLLATDSWHDGHTITTRRWDSNHSIAACTRCECTVGDPIKKEYRSAHVLDSRTPGRDIITKEKPTYVY